MTTTLPEGGDAVPAFKYWAFLSYSHADARWAAWLHREIETYRVPKALVGTRADADAPDRPARLFPVFRDREELPSASNLGAKIEAALGASRYLVVICSPNAVRSHWVGEEIKAFKALGREGRVFSLIVDGEPHASGKPGLEAQECFPVPLRFRVDAQRQVTGEPAEPIAADARPGKDGRRDAGLKLLAGLLDVGFDALKQRDQERRIRLFAISSAVMLALSIAFAAITWFAVRKSDEAQREARAARAALSSQLATHSNLSLAQSPQRSLLLAVAALQVTGERGEPRVPAAEEALRSALANAGGSVFAGSAEPMSALDLSPDGRWLAVATESGAGAALWDLHDRTGTAIALGAAQTLAISPDSRWLATAANDPQPARLWDLRGAKPAPARDLPQAAAPLVFSRDGRWLVSGGSDRAVRLWKIADPGSAPVVLPAQPNPTTVVAISPDSRWLATGSWSERHDALGAAPSIATLWDLGAADPSVMVRKLDAGRASVSHLVFSRDGRRLATASAEYLAHQFRFDNSVRLFDLGRHDAPPLVLGGGDARSITALVMSADSQRLAAGSMDGTIRVWDLGTTDPAAHALELPRQTQNIAGLAFANDNRLLVTITGGFSDDSRPRAATAAVWNLEAAERAAKDPASKTVGPADESRLPAVIGEDGRALAVASHRVSDDGRDLLLAGAASLHLLDLSDPDPIRSLRTLRGHEGGVKALALSANAVASIGEDRTARLWSRAQERFVASPQFLAGDWGSGAALSGGNGRWLVAKGVRKLRGHDDEVAVLWDLATPTARPHHLGGHGGVVFEAAISPDARWVATASQDGKARLWPLGPEGPADAPIVLEGHADAVHAVGFSGDGRWLATGSADKTVRLWDLSRNPPSAAGVPLPTGDTVFSVQVLASRWVVATGVAPMVPTLWDLNAKDVAASARPLSGAESFVDSSSDGRWLVAFGVDERRALNEAMRRSRDPAEHKRLSEQIAAFKRSVALWDLRSDVLQRRALQQADDRVSFSPDAKWLVTSGVDKVPRLWALEPADAQAIELRGHAAELEHVAFSVDNRWLATSDYDGQVRLWDLRSSDIAQASQSVASLPWSLDALAFSRDGQLLLGGRDVTKIFPLDQGHPGPPMTLPTGTSRLSHAVFTGDGRWLGARDHDNNALTLWALGLGDLIQLACGTAGRDVDSEERRLYRVGAAGRPVCARSPLR